MSDLAAGAHLTDKATLTPIVRKLLANDAAVVVAATAQAIAGGYAAETVGGRGVYRVAGSALVYGQIVDWSVVLKILGEAPGVGSHDVTAWNYWKREVLVYQSGLLSTLEGQFSAPRCIAVVDYPGNQYWVWLEDIADQTAIWSIDDYNCAARHLGQFNGNYLVGRPLPNYPWLSKGRVRSWLEDAKPILDNLRPFLREAKRPHWLTEPQIERVLALWANRELLTGALDRLPRTFCHHDAFRRNLFAGSRKTGTSGTIAIDWQIAGTGAVAEDIVPLVGITLQFMNLEPAKLKDLEDAVLAGYIAGLQDAGWRGDERIVRFGYAAAAALFIGVATIGCWPSVAHESWYLATERAIGYPIDAIIANFGEMQDHFLDLGDQALELQELL